MIKIALADGWNHIIIGDVSDYLAEMRALLRTRTVSEAIVESATSATTAQTHGETASSKDGFAKHTKEATGDQAGGTSIARKLCTIS